MIVPEKQSAPPELHQPGDRDTLTTGALCVAGAAAAWYLLRELAPLLRPLLLAVLLCYVILPTYLRLRRSMPGLLAVVLLAAGAVGALYLLALLLYTSAVELSRDLPHLIEKAQAMATELQEWLRERLPWLAGAGRRPALETPGTARINDAVNALAGAAADVLGESLVVGFYLLFLLLEARRFPDRLRGAFTSERAEQVLAVAGNINRAMAGYLRVKVKASLVLAVPAMLILLPFGVRFPLLWGVLTFVANFIPYLGSIVSCSLPIVLAFLQLGFGWQSVSVAVLLLSLHLASAYLVEPAMTGRAVGLSPLAILLALAFWGLCWGLIGMVLAVPLTVMLKIVLENVSVTRPIARLLGEE